MSVVIPLREGRHTIGACLDTIASQDYQGPLECVVAVAAEPPQVDDIRSQYTAPWLRWVDNAASTTPAGLNVAIGIAQGEVIARCDSHALLPPDYLTKAVAILREQGAAVVGGVQRAVGKTFTERAIAQGMTSRMGVGDSRFHYGGRAGPTDTVYLGVFSREVLDEVGGYDEDLVRNQDYELNWRIRQAGHTVYFDPSLEVEYRPRASLGGLWQQYWDYGRWKRRVLWKHPGSLRWRQLAPPLLVLALIGSLVLALTPWRPWALVVPAAYLGALLASTAVGWVSSRDWAATALPAVFATMHLAWGLGVLLGSTRSGATHH